MSIYSSEGSTSSAASLAASEEPPQQLSDILGDVWALDQGSRGSQRPGPSMALRSEVSHQHCGLG